MSITKKIFLGSLAALTILAGVTPPSPVQAALSITAITPNQVVNDVPNMITVSGSDFPPEALVKIGGSDPASSISLVTNRISDTELLANLPKDYPPGVYTVHVVTVSDTASLPAGLKVLAPTPLPTETPPPFTRPQISVKSYSTNVGSIKYGENFKLDVQLVNMGGSRATNLQVSFNSSQLLMLKNGGVISLGNLEPGATINLSQTMIAANPLTGSTLATVEMNVSYYDTAGTPYSERFSLNLKTAKDPSVSYPAPTPTPTGIQSARLMISTYATDNAPLEPGLQFSLELTIINQGDLPAKSVVMIVGGGSGPSGGSGTPGPGGIAGSGGDFTNFAPINSSNIQALGDIAAHGTLTASQAMIVNVNTNPGVYPMKINFSYTDSKGNSINDEQVITLLVYSLPRVEIDFYQPVVEFYAGQPNLLPLQVVNVGRRYTVLSNLTLDSPDGMIENGQMYVGYLDTGGYIILDAYLIPQEAGQAEIQVQIAYTDDFNQQQTITKILTVPVLEMLVEPIPDPAYPDPPQGNGAESWWGKVGRLVLGLLGLDSSPPAAPPPLEGEPEIAPPAPVSKPGKG